MSSSKNLSDFSGQGQGVKGRYLGLPDSFSSKNSSRIVLLPIAFDKTTTYGKGSDKGPESLIEASRNIELYDIETASEVYLNGIYTYPIIDKSTSEEMIDAAYKIVKEELNKNKFVVTIGGEHSISYGPIKAFAHHYKKLTILQLDAHADLQDRYEENPFSHACIMARVKEIPEVNTIVSVGIRSLSNQEVAALHLIHPFFAHEIYQNEAWIEDVLKLLEGPIYITVDLDVFDSSLMPSTGTPEPGGLNWYQVTHFLKRVFEERNVVGFDVVELSPNPCNHAPDYLAAKLVYKMLSYRFNERK